MDKYFEPVTARSLAEKAYEMVMTAKVPMTNWKQQIINGIEKMLEPHIREPSDGDKPMFNLKADVEWLVRGCMRIMHKKQDGDGKAYRELKEFVSQKVSPTGPETKSVPQRCEETYNEAVRIIKNFVDTFALAFISDTNSRKAEEFLKKPNPFKEADIVHEDETEPTLLPFSLEEAKNGAKVVTRELNDVKIVADDLTGNHPLLAVVSTGRVKVSCRYTIGGSTESQHPPMDLFILKEPETIEIRVMKHKKTGQVDVLAPDEEFMNKEQWELIKTIKTTI